MFGFGRRKKNFSKMSKSERLEAFSSDYKSDDYLELERKKERERKERERKEEEQRKKEEERRRKEEKRRRDEELFIWDFVNERKDDDDKGGGFGW